MKRLILIMIVVMAQPVHAFKFTPLRWTRIFICDLANALVVSQPAMDRAFYNQSVVNGTMNPYYAAAAIEGTRAEPARVGLCGYEMNYSENIEELEAFRRKHGLAPIRGGYL